MQGQTRGKFITLEGGEGVGKSTLMRGLEAWLRSRQIDLVVTREPGGTPIADDVRRIFKSPPQGEEITAETEALLVSASRAQHVAKVIAPALSRGAWVLCDRFADSTRVYQGLLGGVPLNDLEWLIRFSTGQVQPDLTFLLDCDVAVSSKRIHRSHGGRDDAARYDQASDAVHERLRQGFRRVAGFFPARFFILNASLEPKAVLAEATAALVERWKI